MKRESLHIIVYKGLCGFSMQCVGTHIVCLHTWAIDDSRFCRCGERNNERDEGMSEVEEKNGKCEGASIMTIIRV